MKQSHLEIVSTFLFLLAIIHTLFINKISKSFKMVAKLEVELVFLFWSALFLILSLVIVGFSNTLSFLSTLQYKEPLFIFVIMIVAATKPIIIFFENIIHFLSKKIPLPASMSFYIVGLVLGPLLGSLITEPAAMAMTALILLDVVFYSPKSENFKYATLGLLLVNVSIGGTLTHFSAPPVLMVASSWNWNTSFMFLHFGYKAIMAILISTLFFTSLFRHELQGDIQRIKKEVQFTRAHLFFLFLIIFYSHEMKIFVPIFLLFYFMKKNQEKLKIKDAMMVSLFLLGLIILGSMQAWWIRIIFEKLSVLSLFLGTTALTAITDNALLTYLGTLANIDDKFKYALVAGAVSGGGLTIIANAPNPIAFNIFKDHFENGVNPIKLFLWALLPTIIAMISFWVLPS